jgi:hypothetical protein
MRRSGQAGALRRAVLAVALAIAAAGAARAEVVAASPSGFLVRETALTGLTPAAAFKRFTSIGAWWSSDHTYSHDARNMHLDARIGGCWCETLPGGGGVRHMEVVYVDPGKILRLTGGLGPLGALAVSGVMTATFEPAPGGSKVTVSYAVGGYSADGLTALSAGVDRVLGEQIARFAQTPAPPAPPMPPTPLKPPTPTP